MTALDDVFASHTALTLAHILPALLFVLLAPVIVFRPDTTPAWIHRAFYSLGAIVGLTAYAMSLYSVGGWTERSAVLLFNTLFLISLARACVFHSRADTTMSAAGNFGPSPSCSASPPPAPSWASSLRQPASLTSCPNSSSAWPSGLASRSTSLPSSSGSIPSIATANAALHSQIPNSPMRSAT